MLELFYDCSDEIQVGVDEAGRGCFAGPVVAAAVIWDTDWITSQQSSDDDSNVKLLELIKDSKKVSKKNRDKLFDFIKKYAKAYSVQFVDESVIDEKNILNATYLAMHRSLEAINIPFDRILVDGDKFAPYKNTDPTRPFIHVPHNCIAGGDDKYINIASASILAKVSRDTYMEQLSKDHPDLNEKYDWNNNKGYGTKKHIDGIRTYGICEHHRRTFGICKEF